jgi:hypothetical protein
MGTSRIPIPKAARDKLLNWLYGGTDKFKIEPGPELHDYIKKLDVNDTDLLNLCIENKGEVVHKWLHYLPLYERYLSRYRNTQVRILEIGVSKGGSLKIWRQYFGSQATIFGVDINPDCKRFDGLAASVRIGSQVDKDFLYGTIREMGGIDVVIDDGSHQMSHIRETLCILFPELSSGGVYIVEDLHTAFWPGFGGGYRSRGNFFNFISGITKDMHHWYHSKGINNPSVVPACSGIHVHDSFVAFEKSDPIEPRHVKLGSS